MRIIAGRFKGKPIMFLKSLKTRPLKDSVKENIFNVVTHSKIIGVELNNSKILDLYSGIGSFGLEAISRGAKKVTFIDKSKEAISILKKNIANLGIENNIELFHSDIMNILERDKVDKFNIFFFDPPFKDKSFIEIIKLIKNKKIFKKKNLVIIHREKSSEDDLDELLSVMLTKSYGRSKVLFGKLT